MYGQPRTGISGGVYIILGVIVALFLVGKSLISKGKKLSVGKSGVVISRKMSETTLLPRVIYHQN